MSSKIKLSFTLKKSDERKLEDREIIKYRRDNRLRYWNNSYGTNFAVFNVLYTAYINKEKARVSNNSLQIIRNHNIITLLAILL